MSTHSPDNPPPRSNFWFNLIVALVCLVCFGVAAIFIFYVRDESAPADTDLLVRDTVVPASQNGFAQLQSLPEKQLNFTDFAAAHGVDEDTADKIRWGDVKNDALVNDFLSQARPVFAQIDSLLALPYFADNREMDVKNLKHIPIPYLASTVALSSMMYQRSGNYTQATQDVLRVRGLVSRMSETTSSLLQTLSVTYWNRWAMDQSHQLLNDPALPRDAQAELIRAYEKEMPWSAFFQKSYFIEYQLVKEDVKSRTALADLLGSPAGAPEVTVLEFTLQKHKTLDQFAAFYRLARQALGGSYAKIDFKKLDSNFTVWDTASGGLPYAPSGGVRFVFAPNFGGRILLDILCSEAQRYITQPYMASAQDHLLLAGFAVRQYFEDNHALPPTLADLVPKYLPEVPLDPFDAKPLRYDPKRGLIYSIGKSLVDSGGSKSVGKPDTDPDYEDPLYDDDQPTLMLTFQNPPAPPPVPATTSNPPK